MNKDSKTNIEELKNKVQRFCEERDWDQYHNAKDLAIGIITESSELLEKFRFKSVAEIDELFEDPHKRIKITEEAADIFYFLLRFAQMYNIDLSSELEQKLEQNKIKYPVDKSKGSNKKYDEL